MTDLQNDILEATEEMPAEVAEDAVETSEAEVVEETAETAEETAETSEETAVPEGKKKKGSSPKRLGVLAAILGGVSLFSPVVTFAVGCVGVTISIFFYLFLALFFNFRYDILNVIISVHPLANLMMLLVGACFAVLAVVALLIAGRARDKESGRLTVAGKLGGIFAVGGLLGTSVPVILQVIGAVLGFLYRGIHFLIFI